MVVISTANGLKFTDFKVGYHEKKLPGVAGSKYANQPVLLPNEYGPVRDAVRRTLGMPASPAHGSSRSASPPVGD